MIFKTRYFIIPVVLQATKKLVKISFKIPEEFVAVTGIMIDSGRVGVGAKPEGLVSLNFNSKASNPLRIRFKYEPFSTKKRKFEYIELKEAASGGTYIDGYMKLETPIGVGQFVNILVKGKKAYPEYERVHP